MRPVIAALLFGLAAMFAAAPARAVLPSEQLSDPKLEARARHISQELRCVVCQNQTIDDSEAPLAHDLRVLLRERLLKGDTDEQAKAFLVKRYGTFVLLKPPFDTDTFLLWFGPLAVLLIGGTVATVYVRRRGRLKDAGALTAGEEAALKRILNTGEGV